jgi:hypothetical protein
MTHETFVGKLNKYSCPICRADLITIDRDDGTTPFSMNCITPACPGLMRSHVYSKVQGTPTHEWRKPTIAEFNALSRAYKDHVRMGGLVLYPIEVTGK